MEASSDDPAVKKVDKRWQKKAGLDLRLDKAKIYKDELASAKTTNKSVPVIDSAQMHVDNPGRIGRIETYVDAGDSCKKMKSRAMKRLKKLRNTEDPVIRRKCYYARKRFYSKY